MSTISGRAENIIVLAAEIREAELICRVTRQVGFHCTVCRSIEEFCAEIPSEYTGVGVITQEVLKPPDSEKLIDALRNQPAWSELPLMVIAPHRITPAHAAPRILSELRALRAAFLLERPLRIVTLTSTLQMALRERRKQIEQRSAAERDELLRKYQAEHERLEFAQTAGNVGVFEWRLDEDRLIVSPQLESMWGYPPGGYDGTRRSFWASVDPRDVRRARKEMLCGLRQRQAFQVEFRIVRPDGSVRWIYSRARLRTDVPRRIIGINIDVTDRKHAEEALREAQKLESVVTLAAGVAHDFNNLLTAITGNASLLLDLLPPENAARVFAERIMAVANTAAGLTRQLVAYAGKGRMIVEDVDLSELVSGMSGLMRSALPRTVDVRMDLASGLPVIKADRSQIEQVVMNLVVNAGEAIGAERAGVIDIRTTSHERESGARTVCLEVRDSGPGMPDEVKARIFEPFFSTKFLGRGLGLAAVAGIVRSYEGTISVESQPGAGALFRVCFPAHEEPEHAAVQPVPSAVRFTGKGTALVVDDEEYVRDMLQTVLERFGYRVLVAANGKEAVEVYEKNALHITLIVLDLIMPVMSGEHALALIHEKNPDVPVLVSTASPEVDLKRLSALHGRLHLLHKPFTLAQLSARLNSLFSTGFREAS